MIKREHEKIDQMEAKSKDGGSKLKKEVEQKDNAEGKVGTNKNAVKKDK